jgi:hypothetical protein
MRKIGVSMENFGFPRETLVFPMENLGFPWENLAFPIDFFWNFAFRIEILGNLGFPQIIWGF